MNPTRLMAAALLPPGTQGQAAERQALNLRAAVLLGVYLLAAALLIKALHVLLPATLTLPLPGRVLTLTDFADKVARNLVIPALILPAIFLIELLCVGWQDASLRSLLSPRPQRTFRSDLIMFVALRTPLFRMAQIVFTFGLVYLSSDAAHRMVTQATGFSVSLAHLPLALMVFCYLLLDTFVDYWTHRIQHMPALWPIHRFHHAAEEFAVVTADRIHPGDLVSVVLSGFLAGFFQIPAPVFVGYTMAVAVVRYLIHSRIDSDFGWVGRWLILSPAHHRSHHVRDMSLGVGNFGLIPLWDALFGTLKPPRPRSTPIGVATPYRHGWFVLHDMVRDSRDFLRSLVSARARQANRTDV